jgi:hypothetical protein
MPLRASPARHGAGVKLGHDLCGLSESMLGSGDGRFALRACFVNHRTSEADVQAIIDEVVAAASEVNQ